MDNDIDGSWLVFDWECIVNSGLVILVLFCLVLVGILFECIYEFIYYIG